MEILFLIINQLERVLFGEMFYYWYIPSVIWSLNICYRVMVLGEIVFFKEKQEFDYPLDYFG